MVPNHHAHHPGFSGPSGLLMALLFTFGRGDDAKLALRLAEVGPGDRVVDVGCGPGSAVRAAARRGASVTGVDPATVMLRIGRWLTPSRQATYVRGTAESLPLPDGDATALWSIATVHHWQDIAAGLAEARRVLAPAGRFVAIERRTHAGATGVASHGWTDEQADAFADACRTAGFDDVRVEHATTKGRGAVVAVIAGGGLPSVPPAPGGPTTA
jgi:ubiquinone/menaquinone biosynthesis C-methylase UbiE